MTTFDGAAAARIETTARSLVEEHGLPGLGVGVVAGERLVYEAAFGFADIEARRPLRPQSRQRIGSITKTMVALCLMALVDEGRLRLDAPLSDFIPELRVHGPGDASDVTIRRLLSHTAGLSEVGMPDQEADLQALYWTEAPGAGVLDFLDRGVTLDVPPGTKWSYSNLGYGLLGEVLARLEGASCADVLQRRIFAPLQMLDSDMHDTPHPDLATGYHRNPGEAERIAMLGVGLGPTEAPTVDGRNVRGRFQYFAGQAAGAVQSTLPDMARYATALLRRGGGIVQPEAFDTMVGPEWSPDERLMSWGLGFARNRRFGRRVFSHRGGMQGGWNSELTVLPDDDLALIVHTNLFAPRLFPVVERSLLAALVGSANTPATPPGQLDPALLALAPGVYEAGPGKLTNQNVTAVMGRLQIKAQGDRLRLFARRGPWREGVTLLPTAPSTPDLFHLADDDLEPSRVALVRDAAGLVSGLRLDMLIELRRTEAVAPWA